MKSVFFSLVFFILIFINVQVVEAGNAVQCHSVLYYSGSVLSDNSVKFELSFSGPFSTGVTGQWSLDESSKEGDNLNKCQYGPTVITFNSITKDIIVFHENDNSVSYDLSRIDQDDFILTIDCDLFTERESGKNIIKEIYNYILIIVPVLLVGFGIWDFSKAALSSDEGALKKAFKDFKNRVIAAILLFLIPFFLQLIFSIAFKEEQIPDICITD